MTTKATDRNESSEPILPVEVLRMIFETAFQESPGDALRLMLTAKCVHKWLLPLAYHSMVFEGESGYAKFGRFALIYMFHSDSLDSLLSRCTRRLSLKIPAAHLTGQIHQFFKACPNLVELHYWPTVEWRDEAAEEKVLKVILNMPLERLSIGFEQGKIFGSRDVDMPTMAMSRTLTHLDVFRSDCLPSHLMHLRALTHFAVTIDPVNEKSITTATIPSLLGRCAPDHALMKIIIVQLIASNVKVALRDDLVRDERVVEMSNVYGGRPENRHWADGMPDFWERAEERAVKGINNETDIKFVV